MMLPKDVLLKKTNIHLNHQKQAKRYAQNFYDFSFVYKYFKLHLWIWIVKIHDMHSRRLSAYILKTYLNYYLYSYVKLLRFYLVSYASFFLNIRLSYEIQTD